MPVAATPGFTFCVCPDSRLIRAHIESALAACPPDGTNQSREQLAFWGDEDLPQSFWETLTLQGLIHSPKALIIHRAHNLPVEAWKRLSRALGAVASDTWVFLELSVAFEKGKPKVPAHILKLACWKFAEKHNWIWTSPGLDQRSLPRFLQAEASRLGLVFSPGALEALTKRLPQDAAAITMEMEKLFLAVGNDNRILPEHADLLAFEPEPDVFSLLRRMQQGGSVTAVWHDALGKAGSDSMLFMFLAVLLREARTLWQLLAGEKVWLPPQVQESKFRLAQSLGYAGVSRLWHLALEAEKAVKSGERTVDQAMEGLIAGLFSVFNARKPR